MSDPAAWPAIGLLYEATSRFASKFIRALEADLVVTPVYEEVIPF